MEKPIVGKPKPYIKSLFVSDLHLGFSTPAWAEEFDRFLRSAAFPNIFLVGDIIDGWKLNGRNRSKWVQAYNNIIRTFLSAARKGARIRYLIGNHEPSLRPIDLDNVVLDYETTTEIHGRKLLVIHGDRFDLFVRPSMLWLAHLSDHGDAFLFWLQHVLSNRGLRWSFRQAIRTNVKKRTAMISRYREAIKRYTRSKGCEGAIVGHTHHPELRVDPDGFLYGNCGDWEEHTAIIETEKGLALIRYDWQTHIVLQEVAWAPREENVGVPVA